MTLADIAERVGKPHLYIRGLVFRHKLEPLLVLYNPNRRYYSLLKVKELLRHDGRGAAH